MLTTSGIEKLSLALVEHGFDLAMATRYAALIGDTPEVNAAGLWVIRDESGTILDTISPILGP
jgi:hypothetical protein